jgi:hypothetical protein
MLLRDYMPKILCPECKSKGKLPERRIMGDGYCKKHGCFAFYEMGLKEQCDNCAEEKKICQRCGKGL